MRVSNPTVRTIDLSAAAHKYAPALSAESREVGAKVLRKPFAWPFDRAVQRVSRKQILNLDGKVLHNCTAMPSLSGVKWAKKSPG